MKRIFLWFIRPTTLMEYITHMAFWWTLCWTSIAVLGFVIMVTFWPMTPTNDAALDKINTFFAAPLYAIIWFGGWIYMTQFYVKRLKARFKGDKNGNIR